MSEYTLTDEEDNKIEMNLLESKIIEEIKEEYNLIRKWKKIKKYKILSLKDLFELN